MPFRSVSFWSIAGVSLCLAAALSSPRAFATITVTPVRQDGTAMQNRVGTGTTFYYPYGALSSGFLDPGDPSQTNPILAPTSVLNWNSVNTGANETEAPASTTDAIFFKVVSDKTLTPSSGSGLAVTAKLTAANGSYYVPISLVALGGSSVGSCAQGSGSCYINVLQTATNPVGGNTYTVDAGNSFYRYAVPYTSGSPAIIGIYPADLCYSLSQAGQTSTACSGNLPVTPPTGTTSAMSLSINIESIPNASATSMSPVVVLPITSGAPAAVETAVSVSLAFETAGPSATCPPSPMTDIYKPGDGKILLDTTAFTSLANTGTNAPVTSMIVVAKDSSSALDMSSTFATSGVNAPVQRIPTGDTSQAVTGFTNTTDGTDHNYVVGFMVRDAAGVAVVPSGSCTLGTPTVGVQTATISGFLKKSSCFIATAAYRSGDAAPVVMLRQFRDRILLHHSWGRAFTHWYYGWSPPAAEWLMDHPVFRYPVLLALIPVELIAWGSLHPAIIAAILLCAALGFFAAQASRRDPT